MHEKVGIKKHCLTPHSKKWGVNWPHWPRAAASTTPLSYIRVRPVTPVGVRPQTDTHTTYARDHNTFCIVYDSHKM